MAKKIITLAKVLNEARAILDAYNEWSMQDGPYVAFNGMPTRGLSKKVIDRIQLCTNETADELGPKSRADVEPSARRLMLVLDELAYSTLRWLQDASKGLSGARPAGSDTMDNAFKTLDAALGVRKLSPPAPISVLIAQGAPMSTIAIKYGWKLPDGSPDIDKLYEERDKPGTHFNAKSWVHPSELTAQLEADRLWEARAPRPALFHDDSRTAPKPQIRSLEDMIQQLAPAEQIARVHKLEVHEVNELAKDMGIDLEAARHVKPVNEHGMHTENMARQEATAAAVAKANAASTPTA